MELCISKDAVRFLGVLILFFSSFCLKFCAAISSISVNQSITDPASIISSNEAFRLGFFCPVNSTNRYVGIWFNNNNTVRTVVWVANRDKPLTDSSGSLTISEDGNLLVLNGQKGIIWSSNVSKPAANSTAQLLDTGDLVLQDNSNGMTLWESFKNLSDSYLQNMNLVSDTRTHEKTLLKSWKSPSDPFVGSFYAGINPLTIPEVYIWNGSRPYWRSGPWNRQSFIGIPGMNSEYHDCFTVVDDKEGTVNMTYTIPDDSLVVYLVLNHDGNLLEKNLRGLTEEWVVSGSSRKTECDVYGRCGPFGSCNSMSTPICSCLKGFEPQNKEEWNGGNFADGCVRKMPLQCERNGSSTSDKRDGFLNLTTMKVPEMAGCMVWSGSLIECGDQCLKNCSCTAHAYYQGIGCMVWSGSLIDIQKFSSGGADLYIRVAYSELDRKRNMKVVTAVSVTVGSIVIAICAYFSWMWMAKQRGMKKKKWFKHSIETSFEELPLFKFEKLAIATENFDMTNKLGQGGFGLVYKGKLPDGQEIAVKRLSRSSNQGLEEFMNEVVVISKLQHRNLVRLLGCCLEGEEKMLIYEYLPNKSLDAFLFAPHKKVLLDLGKRLNIIEGIARGLLYLHRDSRLRIIHRDLKASNILLDEELHPKISDFGMARIFGSNEDQAKTVRVVGTFGYMAPEYAMEGKFSEKSDVFSFGVLLLEIVSGRRNTSFYNDEQSVSLLGYAWNLWNENNIVPLIDPTISCQEFRLEILRCIHIGLLCVQEYAIERPNMSAVLSMLTSELQILPSQSSLHLLKDRFCLRLNLRNKAKIDVLQMILLLQLLKAVNN